MLGLPKEGPARVANSGPIVVEGGGLVATHSARQACHDDSERTVGKRVICHVCDCFGPKNL